LLQKNVAFVVRLRNVQRAEIHDKDASLSQIGSV